MCKTHCSGDISVIGDIEADYVCLVVHKERELHSKCEDNSSNENSWNKFEDHSKSRSFTFRNYAVFFSRQVSTKTIELVSIQI